MNRWELVMVVCFILMCVGLFTGVINSVGISDPTVNSVSGSLLLIGLAGTIIGDYKSSKADKEMNR